MAPKRWGRKKSSKSDAELPEVANGNAVSSGYATSTSAKTNSNQNQHTQGKRSLDGKRLGVVWFKWSDLRLIDNEPLLRAHQECDHVIHLHVIETNLLVGSGSVSGLPRCSPARAKFWKECVMDLSRNLASRGSSLLVEYGDEVGQIIVDIVDKRKCSGIGVQVEEFASVIVYAHADFCTEELSTTCTAERKLKDVGIALKTFWGALTVHHIDDLGFDLASMPEYKGEFNRAAKKIPIRPVLPEPKVFRPSISLAVVGAEAVGGIDHIFSKHSAMISSHKECNDFFTASVEVGADDPLTNIEFIKEKSSFGVSYRDGSFVWVGGESTARDYLDQFFRTPEALWNYRGATESFAHGDETNPIFSGTRLSPWLAFGCISAREVVHRAKQVERVHGGKGGGKSKGKGGSTGQRLHTEMLFRDFLRFSALKWGSNLFKVHGPFHTKGTAWGGIGKGAVGRKENEEKFRRWRYGLTGLPFVDAGMRQLRRSGYMAHLHRQCCAAFLARDLGLDWRLGAEHFESCLVDYTPDANWGNWAYRILQRPCLALSRSQTYYSDSNIRHILGATRSKEVVCGGSLNKKGGAGGGSRRVVDVHASTLECLVWPLVHDCKMEHILTWVPELNGLPRDHAREPWRLAEPCYHNDTKTPTKTTGKLSIKPYKDSPLWFCAANRVNWGYEYHYLCGGAWVSPSPTEGFVPGTNYPLPMVPALNIEVKLSRLPCANFIWGDTPADQRPHIVP